MNGPAPSDRPAPAPASAPAAPPAFLTATLPGIGGVLRERPEDFRVDEVPLRRPSGAGDFVRALVEKRGISTPELQRRIGAALELPAVEVGVAGMKDADAVARQWISVPWRLEHRLSASKLRQIELLEVARDHEPLHPGNSAGNRFVIHVRGVGDENVALARADAIVAVLARRGVPNFFGAQRFGIRGEAAEVGARLLRNDALGALDLVLGAPSPLEGDPRARAFRVAYEKKAYREALASVPGRLSSETRLLEMLARGKSKGYVAGMIPPAMRRMALSAWQALLFNRILARRLEQLDVALPGDLLHDGATARPCTDPAADQPAVTALQLHPTAPLFGERVALADGAPGELEREVFAAASVTPAQLVRPAGMALWGERRELRFAPSEFEVAALPGEGSLRFSFRLPAGCFATALLAEVMKDVAPVV